MVGSARKLRVLGDRKLPDPSPPVPWPRRDQGTRALGQHQQRPRRNRVLRRVSARQRQSFCVELRPPGDRGRSDGCQLCRVARRNARRQAMDGFAPRLGEQRRVLTHCGRHRQRRWTVRRWIECEVGEPNFASDRLLQGHPPRRAPDHPERTGPGLLRRHAATLLRDPDGSSFRDWNYRYPRR